MPLTPLTFPVCLWPLVSSFVSCSSALLYPVNASYSRLLELLFDLEWEISMSDFGRRLRSFLCWFLLGCLIMTTSPVFGDEGMWLLNSPPRDLLQKRHNVTLSEAWLERAMKASVRFSNGSGGFVSPEGLIVTNHHIAADALQKLTSKDRNLIRDGYLALTRKQELKCPAMELNVLQEIIVVSDRVNQAVPSGLSDAQANAARRKVLSEIEKESLDKTGLRSEVVTLYQGGVYHLYRYKKYTDVRLVFAPESAIAGFGGDVDNFEYPRFGLDVAFFRAYEGGKPAKVEHYFRWSATGPRENDIVFVTGHPGTTNRLETLAKLEHRRDETLPYALARLRSLEAALLQFSEQSPDNSRMAATDLHSVANARKAFSGQYQGLLDPAIFKEKARLDKDLLTRLSKLGKQQEQPQKSNANKVIYNKAIQRIAEAQKELSQFEKAYLLLERGDAFPSAQFAIARGLIRLSEESKKPNGERLREYRETNLESLKLRLFSPAPIHPELERVKLANGLTFFAEMFGGGHPLVKKVLAGTSPGRRAADLIAKTRLADVSVRKKLAEGGIEVLQASDDPMVQLAQAVDGEARKLRKRYEDKVEEPERRAYGDLAKLRFQAFGETVAPDATFTLRLAFGVVKGYEVDGEVLPPATLFAGAFARAERQGNREPFVLPRRWLEGKDKLELKTPFNFVSTADTIGGNSGSPVLNRAGELVGVNFDRNRHGLVRNFVYTEVQARHISVHSQAVVEALRKIYGAEVLVAELLERK